MKFTSKLKAISLFATVFLCAISIVNAQVAVTATQGIITANYTTVNNAFAAINAGTHQGAIVITVTGTTIETGVPTQLLKSASPSSYSSILIRPNGDATIAADTSLPAARAVLELVGADNITINGDDPNTPGNQNLTIRLETSIKEYTAAISLGSKGFSSDDGDSNIVIKNCIIAGGKVSAISNTRNFAISFTNNMLVPTITYPGFTNSFAHSHRNITIESNTIQKAYYGIYAAGNDTFPHKNIVIMKNKIGSDISDDGIGEVGIYISNSCNIEGNTSAIIEGNDIQVGDGITGGITNMHVMGIMIAEGNHGIQIRKNNIHDILHIPSSSGAWGIAIQGVRNTSINIANNFIRDVAAGQNINNIANAHFGNHGIYAFSEIKSLTLINNTIALQRANFGGGNTANAVSSCLYFASSVAKKFIAYNNIFVNNQPSTRAFCFLINDTANFNNTISNGNDLFSNTGNIASLKSTFYNNLSQWKSATNKDAVSISEDPNFLFSGDLHITTSGITSLESGGLPVSITNISTDFDDDSRPGPSLSVYGGAKMPDIGADEFDGIISDNVPPSILYSPLGKTCDNLDRTLNNVLISDATGIALTGNLVPRIYFSKNGGNWFSNAGILTSGNKYQSYWNFSISSIALGGVSANDLISYYIVAQDLAATPNLGSIPMGAIATDVNNISLPPSSLNSYLVGSSLNGTYTVGIGGNFTTITDAINAYHASCLTGNVTFSLISTSYSSETFPIVINQHKDAGPNSMLTIKPAPGVTVDINTSATSIFNFFGADYVVIDGSNSLGGTSRNLLLTNNSTNASTGIVFTSLGIGSGATHNMIKNIDIIMGDYNTSNIIGVNIAGDDNDNNTVQNCSVKNAYIGISAGNLNLSVIQDSLKIVNNFIGATGISNGYIGFHGIDIAASNGSVISGNIIRNVYTPAFRFVTGIDVSIKVTNTQIANNDISNVLNDGNSGWGSFGISLSSSNAVSGILVANNFISNIVTNVPSNSANANANGIRILGGSNIKVYHNSVSMTGTPAVPNNGFSSCLLILANISGLDVRNNIFSNTEAFSGVTCYNYSIYVAVAGVSFLNIDYNDYYGVTTQNSTFKVGFVNSTGKTGISDWAAFSGGDAHSISIAPDFITASDLHIAAAATISLLESAAPLLAEVITDIDNNSRPGPTGSLYGGAIAGKADIGADEFDRKPSTCLVPTNVSISNITVNSATLSFTAPFISPVNGYEYVLSTIPTLPTGAGTPITTTTVNVANLGDNIIYYVFVRSVCGNGAFSAWTAVVQFTTDCIAVNLPYTEDFNAIAPPNLPNCFVTENLNTGGSTWFTSTAWIAGELGYSIKYAPNPSSAANNWFYLPAFNLTAGTLYNLKFKYLMTGSPASFTEKMKVAIGTDNISTAMTTVILDSPNIKNQNKYYRPMVTFSVPATGVYYIGFNVYSAANQSSLYVDSIAVWENPLPIKLSNFRGYREGMNNILNWTTLTETNNKGFAIERSDDGNNFTQIAFVNSNAKNGNSSQSFNYIFNDIKPLNGNNFYRLKQFDISGQFEYSSIVKINNGNNLQRITLYPNPASNVLNINMYTNSNAAVSVSVTDIVGKIIAQKIVHTNTGTINTSIDISKLQKGTYLLKTIADGIGEINISKFIKQ